MPPAAQWTADLPLPAKYRASIAQHRAEIESILSGKDRRLLIVVGPCSAWPNTAVVEYAKKLAILAEGLKDTLKIVMRVYTQKPRTTNGWTGSINQPDPFSAPDIKLGMRYARQMMLDVIDTGLPIADEALFTHNSEGFLELLSWVAIGARSAENPEHRFFASAADCPVGFKNPTHGHLEAAVNGVVAAQHPHRTVMADHEVQTHGNDYAHLVLRGGKHGPNHSMEHLKHVQALFATHHVKNPAILIDASHDNCRVNGQKMSAIQSDIILQTMRDLKTHPDLAALVKGFMVESFIKPGKQDLRSCDSQSVNLNGLSITDPCLGWEETEQLLHELATTQIQG